MAPRRKGLVKDFCSDRHRAAHRDATIAAQIRAAETAIKDAGLAIVDIRDELERQVAILTGALAMLERCQPKRLRIAQAGTESESNGRKGIDADEVRP